MRGALDRRLLAAVSSKVRYYCNAGRGRGRAAPSPSAAAAAPAAAQTSASATGLGHGGGAAGGRGRIAGTASRPIGETAAPESPAVAKPVAVAGKGRGRGESPVITAQNVGNSGQAAKPNVKSNKKVTATKKSVSVEAAAAATQHAHVNLPDSQAAAAAAPSQAPPPQPSQAAASQLEASEMFSALIQSCLARGLVHEIDYVYSAMQAAHVPPNMQTCQTLIQVYIQLGSVQKMDGIYMEMREVRGGHQKPEPSAQEKTHASEMLGALMNSWYSRGYFQEVDLAYRGLKLSNLSVPLQTYSAIMDSYNRLGNYGAVNLVYEEVRSAMASQQTTVAASPAAQPRATHPGTQPPVQPAAVQPAAVQPAAVQPAAVQPAAVHPAAPQLGAAQAAGAQAQPGVSTTQGYGTQLPAGTYPYPPQQSPVFQPAYSPPPVQPSVQQWPSYYPPYVNMQPGMPNMVFYNPQTQTYQQTAYPGYQQPGYPGYPPTYPPAGYPPTGYPPGYPGAVQYQTPQAVPYAPPPVPPRPVVRPGAPPPQVQAKPTDQAQHATRPKLELQPKALELLQKTALLKEAQDRASALKGQPPVHVQPPLQQVPAAMGVQYSAPQYAPPNVHVTSGVYPRTPPVPTVHPAAQPLRPAFVPRPVGQPMPSAPVPPQVPKPEPEPKVPQVDAKPAAVTAEVKTQVLPPSKAEKKPAAKLQPAPKPTEQKQPVLDTKPAPVKAPMDARPQVRETKASVPAEVKPKAAVKTPDLETTHPVVAGETKPSTTDVDLPAAPAKLKLGLKDKKEVPSQPETASKPEEPPAKLPSLKLNVSGRGKTAASVEAPELPKSPSLQLGIKKQTELSKKIEESPKASEDVTSEERPKSPSLRLGLKKQTDVPKTEPRDAESPHDSDASETEVEAAPALPSLRKKAARGRGKGVPNVDPLASIIGLHTPSDAFLQQDGLLSLEDANLPALPFETRRGGQGRGKVIPVADAAAVAAEKQRLKLLREEAAARAIAILESGLGKSQMSVYLERRKKRFSDQQFSLGGELSPRRATEGRAVSTRKAKDSKQKAVVGEIDVDGALEYIAPEEYMSKGDALSEVEEAVKGTLHRHFLLHVDPEAAMEEFGTNPDIDDKPLPTLEQTLEQAKEELMAQDGIDEKEWEEAVEDVKKRAPQLESLAKRYSGPVKKNAKQNNKELHEIVAKLPPFVSPELTAFTKRAMLTLQNNPGWGARDKKLLLNRLVLNAQHAPTSPTI